MDHTQPITVLLGKVSLLAEIWDAGAIMGYSKTQYITWDIVCMTHDSNNPLNGALSHSHIGPDSLSDLVTFTPAYVKA